MTGWARVLVISFQIIDIEMHMKNVKYYICFAYEP